VSKFSEQKVGGLQRQEQDGRAPNQDKQANPEIIFGALHGFLSVAPEGSPAPTIQGEHWNGGFSHGRIKNVLGWLKGRIRG
jgi:hypothetical protein